MTFTVFRHLKMLAMLTSIFCAQSAFGMLPKLTPLIGLAAKRSAQAARVGLKSLTIKNPVTPAAIRSIMTSQTPQMQCGRCAVPASSVSHLGTTNYLSNASRLDSAQILKLVHEQRRKFSSREKDDVLLDAVLWTLVFAGSAAYAYMILCILLDNLSDGESIINRVFKHFDKAKAAKVYSQKQQQQIEATQLHEDSEKSAKSDENVIEYDHGVQMTEWAETVAKTPEFMNQYQDLIEIAEMLIKMEPISEDIQALIINRYGYNGLAIPADSIEKQLRLENDPLQLKLDKLHEVFMKKLNGVFDKIWKDLPADPIMQLVYVEAWERIIWAGVLTRFYYTDSLGAWGDFYEEYSQIKQLRKKLYRQYPAEAQKVEQQLKTELEQKKQEGKETSFGVAGQRITHEDRMLNMVMDRLNERFFSESHWSELEQKQQKEAEAKQQQQQADRIKIAGAATAAIKFS